MISPPQIELTSDEKRLFEVLLDIVHENELTTTLRVAGGWVRDKLLHRPNHDIDIALDNMMGLQFATLANAYLEKHSMEHKEIAVIQANPEQSKHLETARIKLLGFEIDLVNLRSECYAESSRIPTIALGTPLEDAQRRDLTINALFYNINTGRVEDFTGLGLPDLRAGLIRTPLSPRQTLLDDPLRALRAVRFAARLGFHMVDDLCSALSSPEIEAALLTKISRERVGTELQGVLNGPRPLQGLSMFVQNGLVDAIFPIPVAAGQPPRRWTGTEAARGLLVVRFAMRRVPAPPPPDDSTVGLRVAVLLAAFLSPLAGQTFAAHKGRALSVAREIVRERLQLPVRTADLVAHMHTDAAALTPLVARFCTQPADGFDRVTVGMTLRSVGEHWRFALDLARCMERAALAAAKPTAASGATTGAGADADVTAAEEPPADPESAACDNAYAHFEERIEAEGLAHSAQVRPLLDGQALCTALATRPGPHVGPLLDAVLRWQFAHPGAGEPECRAWLQTDGARLVAEAKATASAGAGGGRGAKQVPPKQQQEQR